jgi:hypothetical protein
MNRWGCFLCAMLTLWVSVASARPVGLVQPTNPAPLVRELATRLHGELTAVGFDVRWISSATHLEAGAATNGVDLETSWGATGLGAALAIVSDGVTVAVEVWTIDSDARVHLDRVELAEAADDRSGQLAIHAVEVLRAALLERDFAERQGSTAPSAAASNPDTSKSAPVATTPRATVPSTTNAHNLTDAHVDEGAAASDRATFGIAAGVTTLGSLAGVGPALLPTVRLDATFGSSLTIHVTGAGLGTKPTVTANGGSARVTQTYVLLGARHRFGIGQSLRPFVGLAAGALDTGIAGRADAPLSAHQRRQWSLLIEGSVGGELRLLDRGYLSLSGHVQFAQPNVAIHIVDMMAASTGGPNLALNVSVGMWL